MQGMVVSPWGIDLLIWSNIKYPHIYLARDLAWQENWLGKRIGLARVLAWQETGLAKEWAWQENWLGKSIGLARELAWQENWLGKRIGLARELAWQENWLGKRMGLARDLAWQIVFSVTLSQEATCCDRFKSPDHARHGHQSMRYWFIDIIKYQIPAYTGKREFAWQENLLGKREWAWQEIWPGKLFLSWHHH